MQCCDFLTFELWTRLICLGEFFLFELSDLKPIGQTILFKSNRFFKSGVAMHMTNPGWITTYVGFFFHLFVYMYLRICLLCFFLIFGVQDFFCFWCIEDFVFREFFFMFWASRTVIQLILHAFIYSFGILSYLVATCDFNWPFSTNDCHCK